MKVQGPSSHCYPFIPSHGDGDCSCWGQHQSWCNESSPQWRAPENGLFLLFLFQNLCILRKACPTICEPWCRVDVRKWFYLISQQLDQTVPTRRLVAILWTVPTFWDQTLAHSPYLSRQTLNTADSSGAESVLALCCWFSPRPPPPCRRWRRRWRGRRSPPACTCVRPPGRRWLLAEWRIPWRVCWWCRSPHSGGWPRPSWPAWCSSSPSRSAPCCSQLRRTSARLADRLHGAGWSWQRTFPWKSGQCPSEGRSKTKEDWGWLMLTVCVLCTLLVQRQISPWLRKEDRMTPLTASSMLASLKTTAAFLPPSSRETFFREAAVSWAILCPTWVEPGQKYQLVPV